MLHELVYPFEPNRILRNKKKIKSKLLSEKKSLVDKKIALLGGSTFDEIRDILEIFLLDNGIRPIFYASEFNKYWEDIEFENRELDDFKPDLIFFHISWRNISLKPNVSDTEADVEQKFGSEAVKLQSMFEKAYFKYKCPIITNDFDYCYYRILGNHDVSDYHGMNNFISRLNQVIYRFSQKNNYLHVNNLNYLQCLYGIDNFSKPLFWHLYKYAISLPYIPYFSFNIANIIKAIYGKNKKALVLDLDNTLWGGVIGDDGVEGIQLGHETSIGQAYCEFQQYVKDVSSTGVMLTVNSKNEFDNAIMGLQHPDSIIRKDDLITIQANWEPKSENIHKIAKILNIGEDALVFVDDNPAEREIIKQQTTDVVSPDIGEVTDYVSIIDRNGFFESVSLSKDDLSRNEMYKENAKRLDFESSFSDYDEYLNSLEMTAIIKEFDAIYIQRIAQLTNKSNQFNLTTRRYTEDEMMCASKDPDRICLYGRLSDKFGDNGVITVVIGRKEDAFTLGVELWLMSCRVLKRGMEDAMLDQLVMKAKEKGFTKLKGYYIPTAKNQMVADFYERLGFEKTKIEDNGTTAWMLKIECYEIKNKFIEVNQK